MSKYLIHYGVKGMKWGKRKIQKQVNRISSFVTTPEDKQSASDSVKQLRKNLWTGLDGDEALFRAGRNMAKTGKGVSGKRTKQQENFINKISGVANKADSAIRSNDNTKAGRKAIQDLKMHEKITSELVKRRGNIGSRVYRKYAKNRF